MTQKFKPVTEEVTQEDDYLGGKQPPITAASVEGDLNQSSLFQLRNSDVLLEHEHEHLGEPILLQQDFSTESPPGSSSQN